MPRRWQLAGVGVAIAEVKPATTVATTPACDAGRSTPEAERVVRVLRAERELRPGVGGAFAP